MRFICNFREWNVKMKFRCTILDRMTVILCAWSQLGGQIIFNTKWSNGFNHTFSQQVCRCQALYFWRARGRVTFSYDATMYSNEHKTATTKMNSFDSRNWNFFSDCNAQLVQETKVRMGMGFLRKIPLYVSQERGKFVFSSDISGA